MQKGHPDWAGSVSECRRGESRPQSRAPYKFHLLHNAKAMGSLLYAQLPHDYIATRLDRHTPEQLLMLRPNRFRPENWPQPHDDASSASHFGGLGLDHLKVDIQIDLGLMDYPVDEMEFIMIVRDPIDRFLSILNYMAAQPSDDLPPEAWRAMDGAQSPQEAIANLKREPAYGWVPGQPTPTQWKQYPVLESRHDLDVKLYKTTNKTGICEFFARHGIRVDLDVWYNVSLRKYTRADLSQEDLEFLRGYYRKDFELYESAIG